MGTGPAVGRGESEGQGGFLGRLFPERTEHFPVALWDGAESLWIYLGTPGLLCGFCSWQHSGRGGRAVRGPTSRGSSLAGE